MQVLAAHQCLGVRTEWGVLTQTPADKGSAVNHEVSAPFIWSLTHYNQRDDENDDMTIRTTRNRLCETFIGRLARVLSAVRRWAAELQPPGVHPDVSASLFWARPRISADFHHVEIESWSTKVTSASHDSSSTENLHLASNISGRTNIPVSSVGIPNQRTFRGPIHCISSILQTEGLQGLYRGAGAMILRDVPGYVLYFIPYTIFCELLTSDSKSRPNPCSIWLAGGLAGNVHHSTELAHTHGHTLSSVCQHVAAQTDLDLLRLFVQINLYDVPAGG